ncbi:protein ALP1-like [Arachis ipaensis]|uniref:protein ALP1-like n=1 Tax=Arachis ipaensis TaxID=130454 RepID=UPI000A2B51DD|nr:protein ALP1-like [Arachis ipaensis]XP_029148716.1 protein ALP1-like [Arachis hypogaea]
MNFVYVLSGWEGLASDSRILRDAITRRNGLKIPVGCYYLVDASYTNGRGLLSPYKNVCYYVNECVQGHRAPQNHLELFNKKHSSAKNVIERCFGLLKKRWAILRSPSFYPIRIQSHIIIACCLLQNFIRMNMDVDPKEYATLLSEHIHVGDDTIVDEADTIDVVKSSHEWTQWREDLATEMWQIWRGERGV